MKYILLMSGTKAGVDSYSLGRKRILRRIWRPSGASVRS